MNRKRYSRQAVKRQKELLRRKAGRTSRAASVSPHSRERGIATLKKRPGAGDVLNLQRTIGNQAVGKILAEAGKGELVLQRKDEMAGATREKLLEEIWAMVEKAGKKKKKPIYGLGDLRFFEKTGKLRIYSFGAMVVSERKFFSKKIAMLKRGDKITVLGMKGSWCRVKTDDGKLGWLHKNYVLPILPPDPSSAPKAGLSGASRDEVEIAGRG